jgi:hypothetical protein
MDSRKTTDSTEIDTLTLDLSDLSSGMESSMASTIWSADDTITITNGASTPTITIGGGFGPGQAGQILTTNGWNGTAIGSSTAWQNTAMSVNPAGTIELRGEEADIKINDVSLCETLRDIQEKLNVLRPNKELEAEWDQLRELGEQYRKLEAEFVEKSKMWNTLKK